jgi:hypothetical protein
VLKRRMVIQAGAYLTLMVTFRASSVHQRLPFGIQVGTH